jgi:hypothetical protein
LIAALEALRHPKAIVPSAGFSGIDGKAGLIAALEALRHPKTPHVQGR